MKFISRLSALIAVSLCVSALSASAVSDSAYAIKEHGNSHMKIALTFDDGPHGRYTAQILDILKEYGVRATFFVIGENAKKHPELIEREINEGHEIGNHTYSHIKLPSANEAVCEYEIEQTQRIIWEISEYRAKLIRPPEGRCSKAVNAIAEEDGYSVILWSLDTEDWKHRSVTEITSYVLENTSAGDIILCHDFIGGDSPTPQALRVIIPALLERGFNFVTVSELINTN